jgi:hypothetical protein
MRAGIRPWCPIQQSTGGQHAVHYCSSIEFGVRLNDIVGQMVHHVPVRNLTVLGFLLSELGEEVCSSRLLTLLAVISRDFVLGDLRP